MYIHLWDEENNKNFVAPLDKFLEQNTFEIYEENVTHNGIDEYEYSICLSYKHETEIECVFWFNFKSFHEASFFVNCFLFFLCDRTAHEFNSDTAKNFHVRLFNND